MSPRRRDLFRDEHAREDGPTSADWLRYAFLLFLGSLLWLVVLGRREGGVLSLLGVYLLLAVVALIVVRSRQGRS